MAEGLRREIGLFGAVAYGVGTILGAGIYALIGVSTGKAGNAVWLAFAIAAGIALFSGLSYAKLSSIFPSSGAEYVYVKESFGSRFWAFIVGWLVLISSIISGAAVALGFGGYLFALIDVPVAVGASALIIVMSMVNYLGIKESLTLNVILTLIELAGVVIVIFMGVGFLGTVDYLHMPNGLSGVIGAVGIIFFAFIGFEGLVKIGDETKDATRTIPRALILSLVITAVIYVLVAISVVSIVPYQDLAASTSPLSDVALVASGEGASLLLTAIAMIATANTVLIILIASSRIAFGMSVRDALPDILSQVNPRRGTPPAAIAITMAASLLFCFIGGIELTANVANFTIFLVFLAVNLSVIQFSRKGRNMGRGYVLSAVVGSITSLAMLTQFSWEVALLSAVMTLAGAGVFKLSEVRPALS
ncbi:MAG: amino acid permease [Methanomassiliicoccus sp.]|nr:amino acid permease [Methanomassiliicoccus sp.]